MTTDARRIGRLAGAQVGLIAGLLGLALVGWLITDRRMAGMDAGPGTDLGTLGFYITAWVVMMAAMMFPSIAPMVLVYRMIERRRRDHPGAAARGSTSLFVAGYLASWTVFGLLAYTIFVGVRSFSIGAFSWHRGGPYLAGGVLLAAAIYQLTPAKDACLRRCRGPLQFLSQAWRDGPIGAFRMGIEHGGWCVGCCWALMGALFALGIMSVGWMVFVAALIAIEKLLPWKVPANRTIAAVLTGLAVAVALVPANVPGLTLPSSAGAQRAMSAMHGGTMRGGTMRGGTMRGGTMPNTMVPSRKMNSPAMGPASANSP
jgi:predicted metal-binding membrane protein